VTESEAEREALTRRIQIETELLLKKMTAELALEVTEIEAKAKIARASAVRDAEITTLKARAELYERYPEIFEIEMATIQSEAFAGMKTTFVSNGVLVGNANIYQGPKTNPPSLPGTVANSGKQVVMKLEAK